VLTLSITTRSTENSNALPYNLLVAVTPHDSPSDWKTLSACSYAPAAHPDPGRPALHRLNRLEYANSVRDLLDLEIDPASYLPADVMSHGFDNMAVVLNVSPTIGRLCPRGRKD
jgi:Protein of unknown function (DUF1587)